MNILHTLRVKKGFISAALVFIPIIIAFLYITFISNGCMDGFGLAVIASLVVMYIGGPLSVLTSIIALAEVWTYFPSLDESAKIRYALGHVLALLAIPLAIWVAREASQGNFAMFSFK